MKNYDLWEIIFTDMFISSGTDVIVCTCVLISDCTQFIRLLEGSYLLYSTLSSALSF